MQAPETSFPLPPFADFFYYSTLSMLARLFFYTYILNWNKYTMLIEDVENTTIIENYDYYTAIKNLYFNCYNYKIDCKEGKKCNKKTCSCLILK